MLRRVISIECRRSVPVGSLVEIRGAVVQVRQAYLTVGVVGMPLDGHTLPWMDGLLGFVQVDEAGLPVALPGTVAAVPDATPLWQALAKRLEKLGQVEGATGRMDRGRVRSVVDLDAEVHAVDEHVAQVAAVSSVPPSCIRRSWVLPGLIGGGVHVLTLCVRNCGLSGPVG